MAVIDSGAAEICSPNINHFVPGTLIEPCGERIVAAGNEKHEVAKLGRIKTAVKLPDGSLGYIDTGKKLGWYVPSLAFPLFSVGVLKGLGWGFSAFLMSLILAVIPPSMCQL